jgi:hypothetical protein
VVECVWFGRPGFESFAVFFTCLNSYNIQFWCGDANVGQNVTPHNPSLGLNKKSCSQLGHKLYVANIFVLKLIQNILLVSLNKSKFSGNVNVFKLVLPLVSCW